MLLAPVQEYNDKALTSVAGFQTKESAANERSTKPTGIAEGRNFRNAEDMISTYGLKALDCFLSG